MGGIRWNTVHFKHNPSRDEVKVQLLKMTGLALRFDEEFEEYLKVVHPTRPDIVATISWFEKDASKREATLREFGIVMAKQIEFYKGLPESIGVELEIGHIDYLEISALYLLRQLGGKCEINFALPAWAGRKWKDVWPRTKWGQLKARWHGWRFGTLPN